MGRFFPSHNAGAGEYLEPEKTSVYFGKYEVFKREQGFSGITTRTRVTGHKRKLSKSFIFAAGYLPR